MAKRRTADRPDPFDPLDGAVSETLDLHGFSAVEAKTHVPVWIRAAARRNPGGLLHLITGKGKGSSGRPVLGGVVKRLLSDGGIARVKAWGPDGSNGGFLIRIR